MEATAAAITPYMHKLTTVVLISGERRGRDDVVGTFYLFIFIFPSPS